MCAHFLELRVNERVGGLAVGCLVEALLQDDLLGFQKIIAPIRLLRETENLASTSPQGFRLRHGRQIFGEDS